MLAQTGIEPETFWSLVDERSSIIQVVASRQKKLIMQILQCAQSVLLLSRK